MNAWEATLLGFVQGATEFLPVSSSGHLVAGQALLDIALPGVAFEVAVHLATLLSVLLVYRDRVGGLASGVVRRRPEAWTYVGLLAVATVPAGAVGVLLGDWVEAVFESPVVVGVAFLVTGAILWSSKGALDRRPERAPGLRDAVLIGVAQAFALVPGISRSGTTVVAGLWLGVQPVKAAEFSFLMSVPAILGAAVLQLPDARSAELASLAGPLAIGAVVAAVTGVLAIRTFVALLRRGSFHHFAIYLGVIGVLFLGYLWVG